MSRSKQIKSEVTIQRWLEIEGITVHNVGDDTWDAEKCPICGHKACFRFSKQNDLFKCFSCENGGDVITLHEKAKHCSFETACEELAHTFLIEFAKSIKDEAKPPPISPVLMDALKYYTHQRNEYAGPFIRYVTNRKYDKHTVEAFGLGFAGNNGLLQTLQAKFDMETLLKSHLVRKSKNGNLYDFFRNQIIFPYFDANQKLIHLKGKGVDRNGKSNGHVYQLPLNGSDRPIFGKHLKLKADEPLFVCEGETDAIALFQAGKVAWGLGGNPSGKQLIHIHSQLDNGRYVIFVFDHDDAGKKYEARFQNEFISFAWPQTLMEVFNRPGKIGKISFPDKYKDIDECLRENEFDDVVTIKPMVPDLKECIAVYSAYVKAHEIRYSHDVVGRVIYEYFDCYGTFFNVNEDSYLIYNNEQYEIDNSIPFKALIYKLTNINYASQSSKVIWETIRAMTFIHARHTKEAAWIHTDHNDCRIHYNLCNDRNELIRIEPGRVRLCKNGSNPFNIFLFPSPKTEPIEFDPETDIKAGLEKLWGALGYLSTHTRWKFYIVGLILNTFLIEFAKARGINKFTGHQGSGKTDAAGLITSLLYGKNFVTISSTASDYTDAALNPLTINDNLEINNIDDDRKNFLLCVATGITRQKRKAGTDTRNVYEKAVTQVITTSIESFEVPELIERAMIIPFDAKYFASNFPGSVVIEKQLIAHRNEILNSIFLLISEMLVDFNLRKEAYIEYIQKHFPNHAKKRLNEHFACIALSIDVFLQFCDSAKKVYPQVESLLLEWIDEQNEENDDTMRETNIIVRYLDMLSDEWARNRLESYNLEPLDYQEPKQFLVFETTTANLLSAFQLLGKRFQFQQKFKSVRHLASRIKNEITIIESAGWTITQSRIVRGQRNFIFSQKPYGG